jgi:hypothetical protein
MSSILRAFENAFDVMESRNWDCIYVAVDVHDTIFRSNYSDSLLPDEFVPNAIQALKFMTRINQIKLILYTSSSMEHCLQYVEILKEGGIKIDYINENPEVPSKGYADFSSKFYFNVLIDDKAGFDSKSMSSYNDWSLLIEYLKKKIGESVYRSTIDTINIIL